MGPTWVPPGASCPFCVHCLLSVLYTCLNCPGRVVFYRTRVSIGNLAATCWKVWYAILGRARATGRCFHMQPVALRDGARCSNVCYAVLGRARVGARCSNFQPVSLRDAPVAIAKRRCGSTMFQFGILPWVETVTPNEAPVAIVQHGQALTCQRGGRLCIRSLNCKSPSVIFTFLPAHRFSPAWWG